LIGNSYSFSYRQFYFWWSSQWWDAHSEDPSITVIDPMLVVLAERALVVLAESGPVVSAELLVDFLLVVAAACSDRRAVR
jgi:hypothetical protein